jgi:hypothetical protein
VKWKAVEGVNDGDDDWFFFDDDWFDLVVRL